jgi:hypothetical protein
LLARTFLAQAALGVPGRIANTFVGRRCDPRLYDYSYTVLRRLAEAVECLGKSAQLDPNSANTQMMIGLAYGNAGAIDKSESSFKRDSGP